MFTSATSPTKGVALSPQKNVIKIPLLGLKTRLTTSNTTSPARPEFKKQVRDLGSRQLRVSLARIDVEKELEKLSRLKDTDSDDDIIILSPVQKPPQNPISIVRSAQPTFQPPRLIARPAYSSSPAGINLIQPVKNSVQVLSNTPTNVVKLCALPQTNVNLGNTNQRMVTLNPMLPNSGLPILNGPQVPVYRQIVPKVTPSPIVHSSLLFKTLSNHVPTPLSIYHNQVSKVESISMPRLPTIPLPMSAYNRPWPSIPSKSVNVLTPTGNLSVRIPLSATKVTVKSSKLGVNISVNLREPRLILKRLNMTLEKKRLKRNAAARRVRHKQMQQEQHRNQDWVEEHRRQLEELEPVSRISDPMQLGSHFLSEMFGLNELEPSQDEPMPHQEPIQFVCDEPPENFDKEVEEQDDGMAHLLEPEVLLNEEEKSENLEKIIHGEAKTADLGEMSPEQYQDYRSRQNLLQQQRQLQFMQQQEQKNLLYQQQQQQRLIEQQQQNMQQQRLKNQLFQQQPKNLLYQQQQQQKLIEQQQQQKLQQERLKNQLIQQQHQQRAFFQEQQQKAVVNLDDDDDEVQALEEEDPLAVTPEDYIRALKTPEPVVRILPRVVETATLTLPATTPGDLPRKVIVPRSMLNSDNKLSVGSNVLKVSHCQMCGPGLLYSIDFIRQHILQAHGANQQSARLSAVLNTL